MNKIREEVELKFESVNKRNKAIDLQEEIIKDLEEKYSDLIKEGKDEKSAFKQTMSGLSNINELLETLNRENPRPLDKEYLKKTDKKTALTVTISVALFILSLIVLIVTVELGLADYIVMTSFFTIAAIPTCMLIYHFMSKPKYSKMDTTIVEEFKEWKSNKDTTTSLEKSVRSLFWTGVTIIYLVVSFLTFSWHITWIIYVIGGFISEAIKLIMRGDK